MRRRSRATLRAALDAASIPTWTPRPAAGAAGAIAFTQAPASLAPGRRVYAVGDVRGDLAALAAIHEAIRADLAARPIGRATLIHLGDVVGAGADSAGVVALLATPASGPRRITLRGDHEQMLLDALGGDAAAATDWLHETGHAAPADWPGSHVAFLRGLPDFHREGGYFFAHAGIRPGIPLTRQAAEDLRGIRQMFLSSERQFGAVVVHGHSVVPSPVVLTNRIAIDTGAGLGGRLTCAVLEADRIGFLSPGSAQ
ncbi:MAG: metallophosphoesterase [Acetobacteraceae bacterium]